MQAVTLFARDLIRAIFVALVLALFLRTWVVQVFRIPSPSMQPAFEAGDHILVNKFIFAPAAGSWERELLPMRPLRRGDVVVFKFPPDPRRDFVKRCLALAGDRVEIVDKRLRLNGLDLDEAHYARFTDARIYNRSIYLDEAFRRRDNFGPYSVPEGHIFCLGDNRDDSNDSRFWGPVPRGFVRGRPVFVLWSASW